MGHITLVGPSMGIVETRVKSFLKEENSEETRGLFSNSPSCLVDVYTYGGSLYLH